jgi:hypothetical protein
MAVLLSFRGKDLHCTRKLDNLVSQPATTPQEDQMPIYDYNVPDDYDGPLPLHRIVCRSGWYADQGGCPGWHNTAAEVKACFEAKKDGAWPCSWVVQSRYDDGSYFYHDCGAPTRYTDEARGIYECDRGHDHVPAEVRQAEGWDYAADQGEAEQLTRNGVRPMQMDGSAWIS